MSGNGRAPRRERRAAARRLTPSRIYTLKCTGAAATALARCALVRPDGMLVAMTLRAVEEGGSELDIELVQVSQQTGGLRAWLAYKLLGL